MVRLLTETLTDMEPFSDLMHQESKESGKLALQFRVNQFGGAATEMSSIELVSERGLTIRSTGSSGACRRVGLHFILPQTSSHPTAPVNSHVRALK